MRFLLLLVAAIIAVFAGVAALQLSGKGNNSGQPAATSPQSGDVSTVDVLVARDPIPTGTVISPAMLDKQPWPENLVLDGFAVKESEVVGKIARAPFQSREPLIATKLAGSDESGFLASTLPAGKRAVTIATDAVSGIAGYVFPGDRVDVLFTHNIPQDIKSVSGEAQQPAVAAAGNDKPTVTEMLVGNVKVLAINVRSSQIGDGGLGVGGGDSASPSSMTLEVDENQAEKIKLAERVGTLSLALRSLQDKDKASNVSPALMMDLTNIHVMEVQGDDSVKVIRGAAAQRPAATQPQF